MTIAVVIPCRNEAATIASVLDAVAAQDRHVDQIVVVDDGSMDGTAEQVRRWREARANSAVQLIAGPRRGVAAAVNAGIAAARTDVIVRLDGHCRPARDYVGRCVDALVDASVGVAGGVWRIEPGDASRQARAIAVAVSHPFGAGGAAYRSAGSETARTHAGNTRDAGPRLVDTVPFGTFRRTLWQELGGLDERLRSNEDYEFNWRVRQRGLRVMLDPRIACVYFARPTLGALARQYARYGWWKARMLALHPSSIRARQLVPALLVPVLVASAVLAVVTAHAAWLAVPVTYVAAVALAAIHGAATRKTGANVALIAAAFLAMQLAWSAGFLASLPTAFSIRRSSATRRAGAEGRA